MIVDTSALVAIALREPGSVEVRKALEQSESVRISAASLLETYIVIDGKRSPAATRILDDILVRLAFAIEPVTHEQILVARSAYLRFGKGSGHGARLNFGDCFAYALAKARGEPLLFVGDDFGRTDIPAAMRPGRDTPE